MGIVGSRHDDDCPISVNNQSRFSIANVVVTNARNQTLLRAFPNAYPATRFNLQRDLGDDTPIEYVQDPETAGNGLTPSFLVRLSNNDELRFTFTFILRHPHHSNPALTAALNGSSAAAPSETLISGLTYIFASNAKEVENLSVREFHADPNLHKNPNVELVGDFTTGGSPSVQFSWTWKWRPPRPHEDRGGGWRNTCSFVEYNQRAHRLDTLASFNFWVHNTQRYLNTAPRSPRIELAMPPRLRVPSSQSIESRVSNISDSEGEGSYKDFKEPQSPMFETIHENGLNFPVPISSLTTIPTAAASLAGPVKVDVATCRPGEDPTINEDGPVFRATMRSLEQKTGHMRLRMKRILRTAEAAQAAQHNYNSAIADFTQALKEASSSNANAVQPALEHYFDKIAREIMAYEKQNSTNLHKLIIEPISKLYNLEIKQADFKKREFDEESKEYYAYVGKYLGQRSESVKDKKQKHTDEKYQAKRRTFELKRFDYSSFMHDLHGGRKDQEVLSQLTKYADAQAKSYLATAKKVEDMVPQLDALVNEVKMADQDFQLQRKDREEKRRMLETSTKLISEDGNVTVPPGVTTSVRDSLRPGDLDPSRWSSITPSSSSAISQASTSASPPKTNFAVQTPTTATSNATHATPSSVTASPANNKFKGIRDLDDSGANGTANGGAYRKEGLLWALSRPGNYVDPKGITKPGWHKFWIVLDQGKLSEYVNWKDRLDLHMDPIDLRMASVREARSSERRFCFEVITPQFTRVYQAPSEDDMRAWIGSINNALQSAFESKGQQAPPATPSPQPGGIQHRKDIAAVLTGKSSSFSGHRQTSNPNRSEAAKAVSRHSTTANDRPTAYKRFDVDAEPSALLQRIRNADEGNKVCADCESDIKVDWCSINLGVLLCIECSGIHRSLGTHISKVRSLTLDVAVFTPDLIEMLLLIGNRVSNMVWEAKLDRFLKPSAHSTRDQRLHFITAKYCHRTYVQAPVLGPTQTADDFLLTSIKKNDLRSVLSALAQRANPNAHDRSRSTHAVYLALAATEPASPSVFSHSPTSTIITTSTTTTTTTTTSTHINLGGQSGSSSPRAPGTPLPRKPFAMAELLLQNGAEIPVEPPPIPLSQPAKMYLEFKTDQRNGRPLPSTGVNRDSHGDDISALPNIASSTNNINGASGHGYSASVGGGSSSSSSHNNITSPSSTASAEPRMSRDRERLIKRNSSGRPRSRQSLAADALDSLKRS